FVKAQRRLARRDPVLKRLIGLVGPCTMRHDPDGFGVLVRSIISQQISAKAADSIATRLVQGLGRGGLRPKAIRAASDDTLRAAGLSGAKARALRDLADKVHTGAVPLADLPSLPDE